MLHKEKRSSHKRLAGLTRVKAFPHLWRLFIQLDPDTAESARVKEAVLILKNRYTTDHYVYTPSSVKCDDTGGVCMIADIHVQNVGKALAPAQFWDFYLQIPEDEYAGDESKPANEEGSGADSTVEKKSMIRLKRIGDVQQLDLFAEYLYDLDQMILPYYTKKGNLSLRVENIHVMARLDQATINNDHVLTLNGFVIDPNKSIIQKNLLLLDQEGTKTEEWKMENVRRDDLSAAAETLGRSYDDAGFSIQLDLKPIARKWAREDGQTILRFRVEVIYEQDGIKKAEYPVRILARHKVITGRHIYKIGRLKTSLTIKRNKNRSVVFRVAPYTLPGAARDKMKRIKKRVKKSKKMIRLYRRTFKLLSNLPVKKNLVVFESFFGRQYSCNPRAIYEYMHDHCPEYRLVWSASKDHIDLFRRHELPYVRRFSIRWLFCMTRANFWVTNVRLPAWMVKPKHTVYLQTWHGTPLKRLALDMDEVHMPGTNSEKYKMNFLKESSRWDFLIAPNLYSSKIFKRAFGFNGQMIESGYPRNDILYRDHRQQLIRALKEKCGLPADKKILLYAPTWRDNQFYAKGRYKFSLALDLDRMREKLQTDYVLMMRTHYLIADQLDFSAYEGFVRDFSNYEDIRDLYLMADLLITDYSSVFFDYANLRRPIVFFTYDIEDYRDHLRGFYFDFEKEAPGPIVRTTDEVIREVRKSETEDFTATPQYANFLKRFCALEDGHAAERVVHQAFGKR